MVRRDRVCRLRAINTLLIDEALPVLQNGVRHRVHALSAYGSTLFEVGEWVEGTLVRGKYRILTKIGQGGMGSVYKAMHVRFKEIRALKVISPELASDTNFVRRFEQEGVITRRLQHPNAVRVEDIDEAEDGRPFIVMEFIAGRSLKDIIEREAPLSVARVCSIITQAAQC